MPKRIKHEEDPTESALRVVRQVTDDGSLPKAPPEPSKETISAVMAALGRKGGPKGGAARAAKLSPRKRRAIARKAAAARWRKRAT
jgi:hypothetical protein